ncbi:hypothetical protein EI94DRAFT_1813761 [Lactarius quietus]|nr:hypothetical protein EI94DRAFT_1813761 [Lactarius quietus]
MQLKIVDAEPRQPSSAVLFYPGYSGAAFILDPNAQHFLDSTFKDPPAEDEEDWIDDNQELTPLAQGSMTRMAEVRAFERPSWELNTIGPTASATVPCPRDNPCHNGPASSQHGNVSAATLQLAAESIVALAPSASDAEEEQITEVATNLKLVNGVKGPMQLMLTIQSPVIQTVISNSFEGLHATLLFENVFPDQAVSFTFIRDALITAALVHGPSATAMHM